MNMSKNFPPGAVATARPIRKITHFLREWREQRGMTANGLGKAIGMTGSFVSQIENGRAGYTQSSLEKLAGGLKLEPWQILGQDPGKPVFEVIFDIEPEVWEALDEENRRHVLDIAERAKNSLAQMVSTYAEDLARQQSL